MQRTSISGPQPDIKKIQELVEGFLEKDSDTILNRFKKDKEIEEYFSQVYEILFNETPDDEDLEGVNFREMIVQWHGTLKPIWNEIINNLFDFRNNVLPLRNNNSNDIAYIERNYKINFTLPESYLMVNFETGAIKIKREPDIIGGLINFLSDIPIDVFDRCKHCHKCIVITRDGKEYCPGCAAKAIQKEKWRSDPEGQKAKEKKRYREKRLGSSSSRR